MHKLGVYFAPRHDWQSSYDYMRRLQPPVVRILMPGPHDGEIVKRVHDTVPDARIALRWWDLDDGGPENKRHKLSDPMKYGEEDASETIRRITHMEQETPGFPPRSQLLLNAVNEPPIWEPGVRERTVAYCRTFLGAVRPQHLGAAVGCINVGHPAEWPPVWDWFEPVLEAIAYAPGSCLELHEYWQREGPHHTWTDEQGNERRDWGALAGRYQHVPFDVPILIGECGKDGRIYGKEPTPSTGWYGSMPADEYAAQLHAYHDEIARDERIIAALPFLTDYQDDEWATFDTTPAHAAILNLEWDITVIGPGPDPQPEPTGILDPNMVAAIMAIESSGSGILTDGRPVIRFEAHVFQDKLGDDGWFHQHFRYGVPRWTDQQMNVDGEWRLIHTGNQDDEYTALKLAATRDERAAYNATAMGRGQVMGLNAQRIGYPAAGVMHDQFAGILGLENQIVGMMNYILSDPALVAAVNGHDFETVARLYNGPGQVDVYAPRLENAYTRIKAGLLP